MGRGTSAAAEIRKLTAIRLARDLTYEALALEIGVAYSTLHALLTVTPPPRVHARTLYKLRRYLARAA